VCWAFAGRRICRTFDGPDRALEFVAEMSEPRLTRLVAFVISSLV